jgi:hypothetical protein
MDKFLVVLRVRLSSRLPSWKLEMFNLAFAILTAPGNCQRTHPMPQDYSSFLVSRVVIRAPVCICAASTRTWALLRSRCVGAYGGYQPFQRNTYPINTLACAINVSMETERTRYSQKPRPWVSGALVFVDHHTRAPRKQSIRWPDASDWLLFCNSATACPAPSKKTRRVRS